MDDESECYVYVMVKDQQPPFQAFATLAEAERARLLIGNCNAGFAPALYKVPVWPAVGTCDPEEVVL